MGLSEDSVPPKTHWIMIMLIHVPIFPITIYRAMPHFHDFHAMDELLRDGPSSEI